MTLEEAWEKLCSAQFPGLRRREIDNAARAVALAVLTEMQLPCCGAMGEDDPAWCGNPFCLQGAELRRRIEALGR